MPGEQTDPNQLPVGPCSPGHSDGPLLCPLYPLSCLACFQGLRRQSSGRNFDEGDQLVGFKELEKGDANGRRGEKTQISGLWTVLSSRALLMTPVLTVDRYNSLSLSIVSLNKPRS